MRLLLSACYVFDGLVGSPGWAFPPTWSVVNISSINHCTPNIS